MPQAKTAQPQPRAAGHMGRTRTPHGRGTCGRRAQPGTARCSSPDQGRGLGQAGGRLVGRRGPDIGHRFGPAQRSEQCRWQQPGGKRRALRRRGASGADGFLLFSFSLSAAAMRERVGKPQFPACSSAGLRFWMMTRPAVVGAAGRRGRLVGARSARLRTARGESRSPSTRRWIKRPSRTAAARSSAEAAWLSQRVADVVGCGHSTSTFYDDLGGGR